MAPPNITTTLAAEADAPALASLMTAAFSASDAIYPLIWGAAEPGTHDYISKVGLFSPVQRENRVTYKAIDEESRIVGFATWTLPKAKVGKSGEAAGKKGMEEAKEGKGGLPSLPGVNVELWLRKMDGTRVFAERDFNTEKDIDLSFCFVHPDYQRQGIASLLLEWGTKEADARRTRIWCTSTPQAVRVYERSGWRVVERHEVELGACGGEGVYRRAWMVREPVLG